MERKLNKGLSMVEVLIALAVFLVMMVPLVNAIATGMKTSTTGKELQYRNEYAQNLAEGIKEVSIDVLNQADATYFEKLGATNVSISHTTDDTTYVKTNPDGTTANVPFDRYVITGTTYLGVERKEYSYAVEMSSEPYAEAQQLGNLNPNNLKSGVVENLNKSEVALISANFASYDLPAYEALLTKKLSEMRKRQGAAYDPAACLELFKNDKGNRIVNIAVEGDAANGYDVTCTLSYSDNCSVPASTGVNMYRAISRTEYVAYNKHFDKKLPNIYLLYNVCVYNNQYADEYITYDLSGLDDNTEVNVFVIETASNYSTDLKDANAAEGADWLKGGKDKNGNAVDLYKKAAGMSRDSVQIGMALLNSALSPAKEANFHVYHNMLAPNRNDYASEDAYNAAVADWNHHRKNEMLSSDTAVVSSLQSLYADSVHVYKVLPHLAGVNEAQDVKRGLYALKVWMQEGSIDAATLMAQEPVLQGTRGGDEID